MNQLRLHVNRNKLLITHKSARPREAGLLDECAPEILRCAQDDSQGCCHPERSEGSLADFWVITRKFDYCNSGKSLIHYIVRYASNGCRMRCTMLTLMKKEQRRYVGGDTKGDYGLPGGSQAAT